MLRAAVFWKIIYAHFCVEKKKTHNKTKWSRGQKYGSTSVSV